MITTVLGFNEPIVISSDKEDIRIPALIILILLIFIFSLIFIYIDFFISTGGRIILVSILSILAITCVYLRNRLYKNKKISIHLYHTHIEFFEDNKLHSSIAFDSDVIASIHFNYTYSHSRYGPLFGYTFRKKDTLIAISHRYFPLVTIRSLWQPFIAIVNEHNMVHHEDLDDYLTILKDKRG